MRNLETAAILGSAAALALSLGACSSGTTASTTSETETSETSTSAGTTSESTSSKESSSTKTVVAPDVTAEEAVDIALERVPGVVVGIELEGRKGDPMWEVVVRSEDGAGTELKIDATTGEILKEESEDLSKAQEETPKLTALEAADIALKAVPGTLKEVELELEDGVLIWEVKLRDENSDKYKFEIDADTGEILKQEKRD